MANTTGSSIINNTAIGHVYPVLCLVNLLTKLGVVRYRLEKHSAFSAMLGKGHTFPPGAIRLATTDTSLSYLIPVKRGEE